MAKQTEVTQKFDVKEFLASRDELPPVYEAKDFCNRAFTLISTESKTFAPTERNNYNPSLKLIMTIIILATGKQAVLETTQRGIVEPVNALVQGGYFPCDLMIVQEGKFCKVVAV